jgi:glycosyltransferase involved in cell wall biosynthesis
MTSAKPIVSIVLATYNSQETIGACIESIAVQDYKGYELIVIDKVSKDRTIDIIKGYSAQLPRLRVVSEPDNGVYDALNKGIEKASSSWIYFLGSDDIFYNKSTLAAIFDPTPSNSADIIYGDVILKYSKEKYCGKSDFEKLQRLNICHQAIFFKKKVFSELGLYNNSYGAFADWEYNFRWITDKSIHNVYINRPIAIYNEKGLSSKGDIIFDRNKHIIVQRASTKLRFDERLFYLVKKIVIRFMTVFKKSAYPFND